MVERLIPVGAAVETGMAEEPPKAPGTRRQSLFFHPLRPDDSGSLKQFEQVCSGCKSIVSTEAGRFKVGRREELRASKRRLAPRQREPSSSGIRAGSSLLNADCNLLGYSSTPRKGVQEGRLPATND